MIGGGYIGSRSRAPLSAGGDTPTVIADLNWLTDSGILNMVGSPIENGFYVGTWPWVTGGTATSTLAIAAGADGGPVYDTTNGVGSDGTGNLALTLPSPVTIPADADFDLWAWVSATGYTGGPVIGLAEYLTPQTYLSFQYYDDGIDTLDVEMTFPVSSARAYKFSVTTFTPSSMLIRFARVSGAMRFAINGVADVAASVDGTVTGSLSFNTLLGYGDSFATPLTVFAQSGAFLRAARIATYPDGYADRAAYRSAYETSLIGSALT